MIKFRLRELMEEQRRRTGRKITYRVIETETGISKTTLTGMATQKIQNIGVQTTLDKLCDYFNCDISDLMVREKNGSPRNLTIKEP